ncbi:uncharacterized protein LOC110901804 [Helianthus annuus]|uniref:uncharacterized protein LOC110901804 n=1 Tax=Helianthus annuus TaxID=4232 RepID=UPI000B905321|nr:uncharacterized protein LOC110901804 [Helianthus annuus]
MAKMRFPSLWCSWIRGVLSSARSSVLVNGAPHSSSNVEKEGGAVNGIQIPNGGPMISHLLYADDAIILGLKINLSKSNLYGIRVDLAEVKDKARAVGCNAENLPFKYLGLMVGANMNHINNWKPVYDIFEARLSFWKANLLSIGGRITLVKSILECLPNYYFSLYKAPTKVLKDLEALIKRFLWGGGSGEAKKMHWVAWDRVSISKEEGGLGLSKLKHINIALLSKWGWQFKTERNNLWKKVVEGLHSRKSK